MNKTIPLTDIVIPESRQRKEFDPEALQELKNSIEDRGLLHAPVLRQLDGKLVLVAGERRLRAIEEIYLLGGQFWYNGELFQEPRLPYVDIGELSQLEAEEAELDENLRRRDLTWQEHAAAVRKLHELRVAQKESDFEDAVSGGKVHGDADAVGAAFPKHTIADTAEELTGRRDGDYQDTVRKEIIIAKHLNNPAIAGAKDVKEAFKILKKQEETAKNIELGREVGKTFNADKHSLLNVDCIQYMKLLVAANHMPENLFDVICTDPPYGMGADDFGDGAGKLSGIEHRYDDSLDSWTKLMEAWCPLSYAVTKPQAHAYVFCDFDNFHVLKQMMQEAGWYVFRTPLICHKMNSGRVPLPDRGPRRQYELVLYAIKGGKPTTHIYPDVFSTSADENMSHGAQKPVAAFENLLMRSVKPSDRVLDSFAGSGTIFEAAHTFKCAAVGIELNPEYYGMSLARLRKLKALENPDLFRTE